MKKKNYLTIDIDANEIELSSEVKKINIGDVMTKYNFSNIINSNDEKLDMVVKEILDEKGNILVGFACFNLSDLIYINNHLNDIDSSLNTVFIPSSKRIEERFLTAKKNASLYGRWISTDELELENTFKEFRSNLQKIKDGLARLLIRVIEC